MGNIKRGLNGREFHWSDAFHQWSPPGRLPRQLKKPTKSIEGQTPLAGFDEVDIAHLEAKEKPGKTSESDE